MNRPGARARPPRSETRRRILDAAYVLFSERGIATTSLAQVAEAAGLTKGAIYSNFTGKDELVLALMEERTMGRLTSVLDELSAVDDAQEAVAGVGHVLVEAMRSDAAAHRLLAENYAMSFRDPAYREALRARRRDARTAIAEAVVRVQEVTGLRLRLPPDEVAVVLLALSNGLGVESDIDPDAVPEDLLGRLLVLLVDPG